MEVRHVHEFFLLTMGRETGGEKRAQNIVGGLGERLAITTVGISCVVLG